MVTTPVPPRAARVLPRLAPGTFPFCSRWPFLSSGVRMHHVDEGQGPAVVMVHGNPSWSFLYRQAIPTLAKNHRVIVPDHLGCGLSDMPPPGYGFTLAERVADLAELLDSVVPHGPVDLVAHDWGGMIALAWAIDHPERVRRLVLMNTAGFGLPPGAAIPMSLRLARTPLVGSWLVRGLNLFVKGAIRHGVTKPLPPAAAQGFLAPYGTWEERAAIHRFVLDIPLGKGHPSWDLVQRVAGALPSLMDKPLLLLWGLRDFVFTPPFLDQWRRVWPKAQAHVLPEAGHWLLEDEPDECVRRVEAFLQP